MARLMAGALLVLIGADLVGDAACDLPLRVGQESRARLRTGAPDAPREACAAFCVPDCFCCSTSVAASAAVMPPSPVPLTAVAPIAHLRRPEGVRPVADRPPLRLA